MFVWMKWKKLRKRGKLHKNNHYWVFLLWLHFNLIFINSPSMAAAFFMSSHYAAHCIRRRPSTYLDDPQDPLIWNSTRDEDHFSRWFDDTPDSVLHEGNLISQNPPQPPTPTLSAPSPPLWSGSHVIHVGFEKHKFNIITGSIHFSIFPTTFPANSISCLVV